ncbi:JmjC domain, hydroxylase-domain-containing protein, partial [Paraphoma chrysanthemicola]
HYNMNDAQLRQSFQEFCDSPPTSPLSYLIGPTSIFNGASPYTELLSAGSWMKEALVQDVPGVSTSYLYISCSNQPTATNIHFEDCEWLSANIMIAGAPKLWLCIEPSSNPRFEACMEQRYTGLLGSCSQRIRHLNAIVPPRLLDDWGVKYHITACNPGTLIFTLPKTYHEVLNMGPNFAEAINFMTVDSAAIPNGYTFCSPNLC